MTHGPTALARVTQPQRVYNTLSRLAAARDPGDQMPAYAELRARLETNQRSLDLAYERLAAEGIIEVRPRRGVYVRDPWANACFAYILTSLQFRPGMSDQIRQFYLDLRHQIACQMPGAELELLMIDYTSEEHVREQRLRTHVRMFNDRLRLLGCFATVDFRQPETLALLAALDLPLVDHGNAANPRHTIGTLGRHDLLRLGYDHLRREGWQRITVVDEVYGDLGTAAAARYRVASSRAAATLCPGAELRLLQVPLAERIDDHAAVLVQELIRAESLPEAFLVLDDHLCRGLLRGALDVGLHLEERCALVTVSNEGVPIHAGRDLTRLETPLPELAVASCQVMRGALRGTAAEPPVVAPRLIVGQTSRRRDYPALSPNAEVQQ